MHIRIFLFSAVLGFGIVLFQNCGSNLSIANPDFNHDIAPIVHKNCSPCHRPGGVAPFSLITFEQVKNKSKTIAKVTQSRLMPPWPANPGYSHFIGEKVLTNAEIEMLSVWSDNGCKQGSGDAPLYKFPEYKSNLGKPDLILYLDSVQLLAERKDRFFLMKIAGQIPRDTWVKAIEFIAGTPKRVHHFNGHLLLYDSDKKNNVFDGESKIEISEGEYDQDFPRLKLYQDDNSKPQRIHSAVNYLPGVFGVKYPEGIGTFPLTKKFAFIANDIHYGPGKKNETDKSVINVFFAKQPPKRITLELMMGTNGVSKIEPPLVVKANTISKHKTQFVINQDISILTINPHLHMLGKNFLAYAIKPNGDTIKLISIPRWDFRWQYFYTFPKMIKIPVGSTIIAIAEFDNTSNNINNPNNPPKDVSERLEFGGASMRAGDEMFQFIITYLNYENGDENVSLESN